MTMRLLVTGAGGFIGRHVMAALRGNEKIELLAMGRDASRLEGLGTVVVHDLAETPTPGLRSKLGNPDAVLHLAWDALGRFKDPTHITDILPVHARFLAALAEQGVGDITVAGTCFEYGLQQGCLHEDLPAMPVTHYALAKDTLRSFLTLQGQKSPFTFKWLRLFYMYGPGQGARTLLAQLDAALERGDAVFDMSGGQQLRDYLPVQELARRIAAAALQDSLTGIINIGSGAPVSIEQLVCARIAERGGKIELNLGYYPYPDYEPMAFWADTSRLARIYPLASQSASQ